MYLPASTTPQPGKSNLGAVTKLRMLKYNDPCDDCHYCHQSALQHTLPQEQEAHHMQVPMLIQDVDVHVSVDFCCTTSAWRSLSGCSLMFCFAPTISVNLFSKKDHGARAAPLLSPAPLLSRSRRTGSFYVLSPDNSYGHYLQNLWLSFDLWSEERAVAAPEPWAILDIEPH